MRYFIALLFVFCPCAFAQTQDGGPAMQTLLTEVRQLRLAIERSTLLGTRTQIAMERLQVEDTRTSRAAQELERARKELLDTQAEQARIAARIKADEDGMARIQDASERIAVESHIKLTKLELDRLASLEPQQRAREAELFSQVQAGRSRLTELEGRITDMERALDAAVRQLTTP